MARRESLDLHDVWVQVFEGFSREGEGSHDDSGEGEPVMPSLHLMDFYRRVGGSRTARFCDHDFKRALAKYRAKRKVKMKMAKRSRQRNRR